MISNALNFIEMENFSEKPTYNFSIAENGFEILNMGKCLILEKWEDEETNINGWRIKGVFEDVSSQFNKQQIEEHDAKFEFYKESGVIVLIYKGKVLYYIISEELTVDDIPEEFKDISFCPNGRDDVNRLKEFGDGFFWEKINKEFRTVI